MKSAGRRCPTRRSCAASAIWLVGSASGRPRRRTRPGYWSRAARSASSDPMAKQAIMVLGCSSDAGKSFLAAALCRWFARRGERVAPFKAQNMSNNAGVCADGSEIGRAQVLQALAAGVPPEARMNPVLLKPEADTRSQVVLMGRYHRALTATPWLERRDHLWPAIASALDSLLRDFERVILEGAGTPARRARLAAGAHRRPHRGGGSLPAPSPAGGGLFLPSAGATGGQNAGRAGPVSLCIEPRRVRSADPRGWRGGGAAGAAGGPGGSGRRPSPR